MKRRHFLKTATASTIIAGTGLWSYASKKQPSAQNVRWSMGWILWREFSGRSIPLSEAIQDLNDLGADGIEFTPRKNELVSQGFTRESFRDLLAEKNLLVSGHYFSAPFYDTSKREKIISAFNESAESLRFFGAKNIIIGPPLANGRDNRELIRGMAPLLNDLGKMAIDQGIQIGLHPHFGTMIETPEEIHLAMDLTDSKYVFFSPDTGHLQLGGCNILEILNTYKDRINYFHLKDVTGQPDRAHWGTVNIRELGQGSIDFPGIMRFLKQIKYKGWLNVEQDRTALTPRESAAKSMDYINSKLKPIIN